MRRRTGRDSSWTRLFDVQHNTYMGDSGGATYREYSLGIHAVGIQSGYGCGLYGDETIYSHIGMAAVDLGGFTIVT